MEKTPRSQTMCDEEGTNIVKRLSHSSDSKAALVIDSQIKVMDHRAAFSIESSYSVNNGEQSIFGTSLKCVSVSNNDIGGGRRREVVGQWHQVHMMLQ
jgi:hypothetical protein